MRFEKNSEQYWDMRFKEDWHESGGSHQSQSNANALVTRIGLDGSFDGLLSDFGCGTGDAIPVYRACFPKATLIGVDFSSEAIAIAKERYGSIARFVHGSAECIPRSDIVMCSHVLEHVENESEVLNTLLAKAKEVNVCVPYKEKPLWHEHLRTYNRFSFGVDNVVKRIVFQTDEDLTSAIDWTTEYGLKNIFRFLSGRTVKNPRRHLLVQLRNLV